MKDEFRTKSLAVSRRFVPSPFGGHHEVVGARGEGGAIRDFRFAIEFARRVARASCPWWSASALAKRQCHPAAQFDLCPLEYRILLLLDSVVGDVV
ncbi:MAG: hypothetical protein ABSA26_04765 [Thermoguttaceae bacterium]